MKSQEYKFENYSLVSLRQQDIFLIKNWRNAQLDVLRQKNTLTNKNQKEYFKIRIVPTFTLTQPPQILFSYLLNNDCIGYGGLTNIDWDSKRAEMSFLVNPERTLEKKMYEKDFGNYITLINMVVFNDLQFNRLFTETYDMREIHISILENCGFNLEGRLKQHVIINGNYIDSLIHGFLKEYYYV